MVKSEGEAGPKKRKSRGRGLRATTGCIICKRRHVKCDEVRPQCGPCAIRNRSCVYSHDAMTQLDASKSLPEARPRSMTEYATALRTGENAAILTPNPSYGSASSPGTENSQVIRWIELLATDATRAGGEQQQSPQQTPSGQIRNVEGLRHESNHFSCALSQQESFHESWPPEDPENHQNFEAQAPNAASNATDAPSPCISEYPIPLSELELYIFRHFVYDVCKFLDFHDPELHFATTVPHLALRNIGLMRALLALSTRHLSLEGTEKEVLRRTSVEKDGTPANRENPINRNLAVKYYSESLHYLNHAMKCPSYTRSLVFIATAILISTYEIIDGWNQNWERRIKGIFWIQRFQDNDGESKGFRSAAWWTWFQQDIWVAMLERRRVYSVWSPRKHVSSLTAPELARRALYLLAQCVNYVSQEERRADPARRADRGNELLHLLQEWREVLPPDFSPLPFASGGEIFPEIWVNPPSYAAALQIQSLALILVVLHHPSFDTIGDSWTAQHMLTASVSTICGIARSVHADDPGANVVSLKCLYGAMCVHATPERLALLDLLDSCQQRLHWPVESLRKQLELNYSKHAFHDLMF